MATTASTRPVVADTAAVDSAEAAATAPDETIGLHSPPDSNNASKTDGCSSSDSELSCFDDDLAEALSNPPAAEIGSLATAPAADTGAQAEAHVHAHAEADIVHAHVDDTAAASPALPSTNASPGNAAEDDDIGDIEPDEYSGTVPIFRPTMHQFRDFKKFVRFTMEKIDHYGMKSGIVKIVPPQDWSDTVGPVDELVKGIKVREPIKQDIMGSNGTYRQVNILHQRTYNLPQWRQLCDQSEHQPPARRGERRANADKPKPTTRTRSAAAASSATVNTAAGSVPAAPKKGKRGRTTRRWTTRQGVDDDASSVLSEPRPMTPESQRGDDDRLQDDDKTCVETPEDTGIAHEDRDDKPEDTVMVSVEVDHLVKKESSGDAGDAEDSCVEVPAPPRRLGFTRQASAKTQSTSARRKFGKREGSAKIDEALFKDWDYRMDASDYTPERCEELERIYWKTLTYAPPLYGADLPGTLFDENTELWNLNKLPNLLDVLGTKVPGVNTAYLYLGMWKATFAWHLEDVDLYSINYLHFGAPKQWYSISQGDARRFEAAMKNIWPADAKACDQFLRHKAFLISPSHLQQHYNIRVNKCVSYPGEFVVTYPYGYHSGYNLGYNCAEAVNFALESWLPMGKIAKKCECAQAQDSVWVDVYEIERKLRGISTDDEDDEDEDSDDDMDMDDVDDLDDQEGSIIGLPTPPSGRVRIRAPNRKRKRGADTDKGDTADEADGLSRAGARKLKRMRLRLQSAEGSPCCLCPNDIPYAELLPTDDGRKAHRLCALYLPETCIDVIDGKDVVTNVAEFTAARLEVRCMYCRMRKGVCFQCSYTRCTRSYHPTCAAAAGVFVEEGEVPVFGDDGTEYKEQAFEFTCRFQRAKRDKKYDGEALEKNERIRKAASALKKGSICQMQFYRSDIFAGVVLENRADEETVLLHVVPSGDRVEVEWKWLLLPDASDYRLPKASPHALPLPSSRKEKEEIGAKKRPVPVPDDVFVDGFRWKEFHACEAFACRNPDQVRVDLFRPDRLWHYIGRPSTDTKPQYTEDPAHPTHNLKSNFLDSVPKPPVLSMQPPRRPSLPPAPMSLMSQTAQTAGLSPFGSTVLQAQAQIPAGQTAVASPSEPRRSYSVIKPPYVPHTLPTTAAAGQPSSPSDNFPTPRRPSTKHQHGGIQRHRSYSSGHPAPFGSFFSLPAGGNGSKFPQIQHPNLSHGYATIPGKPSGSGSGAPNTSMSPPPAPRPSASQAAEVGAETRGPSASGEAAPLSTSIARKYAFFQVHCNRDPTGYRSPYEPWNSSTKAPESTTRPRSKSRQGSSGAAALAAAANKLHRRGASSTSSASSFGFGLGLKGLTRPSPHTNYVGPAPAPSSTVSSPYLSAHNLPFGPGPGSSVSSYASYDSVMTGGARMSPHSPGPVDASPFVGSPGPQISAFDFPPVSASSYHHPGMRPQFNNSSWQQSFHSPLFSQGELFRDDYLEESMQADGDPVLPDMNEVNFSPPSPIASATSLPGLGAPANIIPSHHQSYSFSGRTMADGSPLLSASMGGYGAMSPPFLEESPLAMSPSMEEEAVPPDGGTQQSPAEQLRQQLRSISDSSLPSTYRLRCLHQPRRRHQSRSSLNRIFTSQLLDLNPT
ncbi:jumonji family transcription factor [Grosmannia clavigera kw1407]|uniref:[histone H3]-trimethyl-L-lysine(9) demethylase n=1 Tax=Grosmannia clavigera (strain kw1407 / UAMH 11150) TaxID=655863 RepID=F0X7L6_GROCL|nr:jumonji family transcription factor [Grosmannia clavigera kw1407]EFX06326.1 jumonji family transcription factor [Grosmannia clavigera kw1407]